MQELTQISARTEDVPGFVRTDSAASVKAPLPSAIDSEEHHINIGPKNERSERRKQRRQLLREALQLNVVRDGDAAAPAVTDGGGGLSTEEPAIQESEFPLLNKPNHTEVSKPNDGAGLQPEGRLLPRKRKGTTTSTRFHLATSQPPPAINNPIRSVASNASKNAATESREDFQFFSNATPAEQSGEPLPHQQQRQPDDNEDAVVVSTEDPSLSDNQPALEASAAPAPSGFTMDDQLTFVDHLDQVIDDGDYWGHVTHLVESGGNDYIPYKQRISNERRVLYEINPDDAVPVHINAASVDNHPEDGFYIGQPLPGTQREKRNFEFRLAKEQHYQFDSWFTGDGDVVRLADPLKPVPMRPEALGDAQELRAAARSCSEYCPAEVSYTHLRSVLGSSEPMDQPFLLEINISSIVLTNHPLFNAEHDVATRLKSLYKQV